ncbi:NAD-dependent epimerase/dehydratase family protein, partial [Chloroflexota bacterium]
MGTILITGGAGMVGRHVARSLADAGEQVVITYRRYFQVPWLLSDVMESRVKAVRCDVMDLPELSRVIRDHGVDSIINAVVVNNYEASIYTCLQSNILGTINVMEAAAIGSVKKVTYMSSGGLATAASETEIVPIASPATGVTTPSKKCAEVLSLYYGATFGISVAIVRGGGGYWGLYREGPVGQAAAIRDTVEGVVMGKPVDLPHVDKDQEFRLSYGRDIGAAISTVHLAPQNQHLVYYLPGGEPTSWGEIDEVIKEFVPGSTITFGRSERPAREEQALPDEELNISREFG